MPGQEDNIEQPLVMFKKEDYHSDNEEEYKIKIDPSAMAGHQRFYQDLGNNPTENDNVNVDAQLKTPVNTQTDSSTSVVSDSSHVGKTPGQDQEDNIEKPLVMFKQRTTIQTMKRTMKLKWIHMQWQVKA